MAKENLEIRAAAKSGGVKLWEVAEVYGVSEGVFSRKMRHEFPEREKKKVLDIIRDLAAKKEQEKRMLA